jgi:hypothetical protein
MENEDNNLGRQGYLDLLIATLTEHEKNLNMLIKKSNKLARRTNRLFENLKEFSKERPKTEGVEKEAQTEAQSVSAHGDTLVYLKIKLDRPIEEVIRILETLKRE